MSELRDLYQEVILDHSKRPRNFGPLSDAHSAKGHNPLCGDHITVHVVLEDDTVTDVRFEGSGCAISTASASMMTEAALGQPVERALELGQALRKLMHGEAPTAAQEEALGDLMALQGVAKFPVRIKCALLPWMALKDALSRAGA